MEGYEVITRDEWVEILRRKLQTKNFEIVSSNVRPLGAGSGFSGDHRRAEIEVKLLNKEPSCEKHFFFIKAYPKLAGQETVMSQTGIFTKEVVVLQKLFRELRSVLKDEGKDMVWTCKCYFTRPDVIVLEDLISQGFKVVHTREDILYEHCALVLKAAANLHSASIIFEETTHKYLNSRDEYKEILSESFFLHRPDHPGTDWLRTSIDGTLRLIELVAGAKKCMEIKEKMKDYLMRMYEMQTPSEIFRNVVCHGDLWRNNILFKHEGDVPVAAHLVDFQIIRYVPPANDVMCFLYLSTTRAFRNKHASQLISLYYEHLSTNLKNYGLKLESTIPWEEFCKSCEFYRTLAIITTAFYSQAILINHDDFQQVFNTSQDFTRFLLADRKNEINTAFAKDEHYRTNITEIIKELLELFEQAK